MALIHLHFHAFGLKETMRNRMRWLARNDKVCMCSSTIKPYLHSPRIGGLVQGILHDLTDCFSLRKDFGQVLGAQHVAQSGGGQKPRRVAERGV